MASKQKGARKIGRNKARCAAYRTSQREEMNKARRLMKHLGKHPEHQAKAWDALKALSGVLYQAQKSALGLGQFLEGAP